MSIYSYLEYRPALAERLVRQKNQPGGVTMAKLAEKIPVQPSYLTNVVKERAHFNADQLHTLCELLGYTAEEIRYLTLLLEHERSSNKSILQARTSSVY